MSMTPPTTAGPTILDISAPLRDDLVTWPGVVERFERNLVASLDAGDAMTVSHLGLGAHAGTHIDAPCHFLPEGGGVETVPLSALMGPAFVVDVPDGVGVITDNFLDDANIPASAPRILAKTSNSGWSTRHTAFQESYVAFDESAAAWCMRHDIELLAIDYLSVEPFDADTRDYPVHKTLLGAGIVVLESVDLADVAPGRYDLVVLPLLIPGADGAPARALLISPD